MRATILTTFTSTAPREVSNEEARLLEEIELLLGSDARDVTRFAKHRLDGISICATAVVKQSRRNASRHHAQLLVFCALAVGKTGCVEAEEVKRKILHFVLVYMHSGNTLYLQGIASLLENDLQLASREEHTMLACVDKFVGMCNEIELPTLLRSTLQALMKAKTRRSAERLGNAALRIIQRASGDVLNDVFVVMEIMALDHEDVCHRLLDAVSGIIRAHGQVGVAYGGVKLCATHVAMLYCMLGVGSSENVRDCVITLLEKVLMSPELPLDCSAAASSSAAADMSSRRRAVLIESIKVPAIINRAHTILGFYQSQIWKNSSELRGWGSFMMFELFVWVPTSQENILKSVFAALAEPCTPQNAVDTFCFLFEKICQTPRAAFALRDCRDIVKEALDSVGLIPWGIDCRVVTALVPVAMSTPVLSDPLFLFLRKVASSRSRKSQKIACSGLLAVIEHDGTSPDVLKEACEALGVIMKVADMSVRSHFIALLLDLLSRKPGFASRVQAFSNSILDRLSVAERDMEIQGSPAAVNASGKRKRFDFTKYFDVVGKDNALRDPVPLMIRYCARVRNANKEVDMFLSRFVAYLGDVNGALLDACSVPSRASVLPRITLLCDLYDTILGLDKDAAAQSHILTYAICLIVRDYLTLKLPRSDQKRVGDSGGNRKGPGSQWTYMTAREAVAFSSNITTVNEKDFDRVSTLQRICALEALSDPLDDGMKTLFTIVRSEVLLHVNNGISTEVGEYGKCAISEAEEVRLLNLIHKSYVSSCSWSLTAKKSADQGYNEVVNGRAELEPSLMHLTQNARSDSPKDAVDGRGLTVVIQGLISPAIPSINAVRKALEPDQVSRGEGNARIQIRHSCLKVLQMLFSANLAQDAQKVVFNLTGDALSLVDELCSPTASRSAIEDHEVGEVIPDQHMGVLAVRRLSQVLRLEFASSMSIGLTLGYLQLLSYLISEVSSDTTESVLGKRECVSSTIKDLLREYSIRHTSVMREMLKLLFRSIDASGGHEFAKSILVWLGNDPCLLDSKFSVEDDGLKGRLGVNDFDIDILEEAIALDIGQPSDTEETYLSTEQDSCVPQTPNIRDGVGGLDEEDVRKQLESLPRIKPTEDPIRSLCLDETPEICLLSMVSALNYFTDSLHEDIRRHRGLAKKEPNQQSFIDTRNASCAVPIASALIEFLKTSFIESLLPKPKLWPPAILKKCSTLILGLLEIVELKCRITLTLLRTASQVEEQVPLLERTTQTLSLLYGSKATDTILLAAENEGRSRRNALQERINILASSMFQVARSRVTQVGPEVRNELVALLRLLQAHKNSLPRGYLLRLPWASPTEKDRPLDEVDVVRVSQPRKRQRIRSRNRVVDEWLQGETGVDNFAELENFIVPMDNRDL